MRKLISVFLAVILALGVCCACAEQDNFLVSDWMLLYTFEDNAIDEQAIFIYEDHTFEMPVENESQKGTWEFDGETLTLTGGDDTMSLKWNEAEHRFSGEYNSMNVTMYMSIEPEEGDLSAEETGEASVTGMLAGGWAVAEDPAITDDLNNIFFQALESYQTGTITVAYTPVALLGTQVVAGTNYAVLSRASEINQGSKWVILYLYQDLEGNASVLSIADIPLGV